MTERPHRVQLSRAKGWKMPPNTLKVDRSTDWGNPFKADDHGTIGAVVLFREWCGDNPDSIYRVMARRVLGGKNLGCWCALDAPCHADVLLEFANPPV